MEYQTETYILKVTYNLSWNTENGKKRTRETGDAGRRIKQKYSKKRRHHMVRRLATIQAQNTSGNSMHP